MNQTSAQEATGDTCNIPPFLTKGKQKNPNAAGIEGPGLGWYKGPASD
jgi:hypothetical protein